MKKIILSFLIIFQTYSNDISFVVRSFDNQNEIIENNSKESIMIKMVSSEEPKILNIQDKEHFKLIHFYAGSAGTYRLVRHEKVAIFDTKKNKFLEKIYITKLEGLDKSAQPTFKIKNGKVIYHFPR